MTFHLLCIASGEAPHRTFEADIFCYIRFVSIHYIIVGPNAVNGYYSLVH